jgi:hypothetical protein
MGPAQPTTTTHSPASSFISLSTTSLHSSPKLSPVPTPTMSVTPATTSTQAATPTTIKKLPANISHLEPNGANWAIFKMHFSNAMKVTHQWGYFIGLKPCSKPADPDRPMTNKAKATKQWEYKDFVATYLLSQWLPDTTEMHLTSCFSTKE